MTEKTKNTRIDLRVTPEQKELLEKAASCKGISLTSYTLSYLLPIAQAEINNYEQLVLSNRDRDLFLNTLENPPVLTGKLKSAIQKYREKYDQ